MRPRFACLLAMLVAAGLVATATADDNDSQQSRRVFPIFRPRTKPTTAPVSAPDTAAPVVAVPATAAPAPAAAPRTQTFILTLAADPVLAPPPANVQVAPAAPAVVAPPPPAGTPYYSISESEGCYVPAPSAYPFAVCNDGRKGRRETDCLGCYSCLGYWRFFCAGCKGFWREGRHEPDFEKGCYCGSR